MNSQQINYKLTQLDLKAKLNEQQYPFQFSSIVIKNDSIILVAEKCNRIYILNKKTLDVISVINDLVFPKDKVSIEGVVLYKNRYLFLLDENNTAIYSYDLKDQKSNIKRIDDKSLKGNKYKLEGIAINEKDSICYVLHEDKSKIYLFDIGKDNQLKKRERINSINLPKDNIPWTRNTDLYYEKNQLYVLSTNYKKKQTDTLKYGISLFSIGGDYTLTYQNTIELIFPESFDYYRLERYSTNLEGLVKDSNLFYVISDNADRDNCDTQINGIKKTLFFKLERE
ncbi:hypothetical protein ABID42_002553 [Arcicella rosea]|uniref:hypothetical protein n=1 Tax=Arcicella rosea TaxID=502909 RepID=UPI00345D34F3